jgi:hypothetical protein
MTLRGHLDWWLNDGFGRGAMRSFLEQRFDYELSPALRAAIGQNHVDHAGGHAWFRHWARRVRLDNRPLAIAFVVASVTLAVIAIAPGLARAAFGRRRRIGTLRGTPDESTALTFVAWVLPVWAYLAVYTVFGAPLYRYQATVHAPMLAAIAVAAFEIAMRLRTALAARLPVGT